MRLMYEKHRHYLENPQQDEHATQTSRLMNYAAMTMAFAFFLRLDEVLTLQIHEVEFQRNPDTNMYRILVTLSFRKNDQEGGTSYWSLLMYYLMYYLMLT